MSEFLLHKRRKLLSIGYGARSYNPSRILKMTYSFHYSYIHVLSISFLFLADKTELKRASARAFQLATDVTVANCTFIICPLITTSRAIAILVKLEDLHLYHQRCLEVFVGKVKLQNIKKHCSKINAETKAGILAHL